MSKVITTSPVVVEVMTEDEAFEYVESTLVEMLNAGEIPTFDPEAASGHLDRSYYQPDAWLSVEYGIDPFAL